MNCDAEPQDGPVTMMDLLPGNRLQSEIDFDGEVSSYINSVVSVQYDISSTSSKQDSRTRTVKLIVRVNDT